MTRPGRQRRRAGGGPDCPRQTSGLTEPAWRGRSGGEPGPPAFSCAAPSYERASAPDTAGATLACCKLRPRPDTAAVPVAMHGRPIDRETPEWPPRLPSASGGSGVGRVDVCVSSSAGPEDSDCRPVLAARPDPVASAAGPAASVSAPPARKRPGGEALSTVPLRSRPVGQRRSPQAAMAPDRRLADAGPSGSAVRVTAR